MGFYKLLMKEVEAGGFYCEVKPDEMDSIEKILARFNEITSPDEGTSEEGHIEVDELLVRALELCGQEAVATAYKRYMEEVGGWYA